MITKKKAESPSWEGQFGLYDAWNWLLKCKEFVKGKRPDGMLSDLFNHFELGTSSVLTVPSTACPIEFCLISVLMDFTHPSG